MGQIEGKELLSPLTSGGSQVSAGGKGRQSTFSLLGHKKESSHDDASQQQQAPQRVFLDLALQNIDTLIPPPKELLTYVMDMSAHERGFFFRYLEALSLESNKLKSLRGLEKVLHLPLLIELNVSNNSIEALEEELFEMMASVERINLSRNKIDYIPPSLASLTNLTELNMSHNEVLYLPHEIGRLKRLILLDFSSNKLHAVPDSINQLTSLKRLMLSNNYLEIFVNPKPGDLRNLVWLDLSWNKIKRFPLNLGNLGGTLEKLYLGHNEMKELDGAELKKMKVLRELSVQHNQLRALPKELANLVDTLVILDIEGNKFREREYKAVNVSDLLMWLKIQELIQLLTLSRLVPNQNRSRRLNTRRGFSLMTIRINCIDLRGKTE